MAKKVKAIFKGQDGSCGYNTNKEYTLWIKHNTKMISYIEIENINGGGYCEYESMISFLDNWDNIRNV